MPTEHSGEPIPEAAGYEEAWDEDDTDEAAAPAEKTLFHSLDPLANLKSLTELRMDSRFAPAEAVEKLAQALPDCRIDVKKV